MNDDFRVGSLATSGDVKYAIFVLDRQRAVKTTFGMLPQHVFVSLPAPHTGVRLLTAADCDFVFTVEDTGTATRDGVAIREYKVVKARYCVPGLTLCSTLLDMINDYYPPLHGIETVHNIITREFWRTRAGAR
jgi:hypothetical protein